MILMESLHNLNEQTKLSLSLKLFAILSVIIHKQSQYKHTIYYSARSSENMYRLKQYHWCGAIA